ncbi:MAG TPA: biotin/lipoyl-binding protein, partial [Opitutus sp.]|nr:biotin/lipoyl-binding protein [Opitutus sp.]
MNYAREAVACERVSLFVASNYDRVLADEAVIGELEYEFHLQACSGLKKPHPKSEQALTLQRVAHKLTQLSMTKAATETAEQNASAATPALPATEVNGQPKTLANSPSAAASPTRPRTQLTLMMRDPSKTPTRPAEVNEYFDLMPMNWATVIPLFDRNQRICGILLFEGVKLEEKLANSLKPMLDLATSAGRALGTTLYFNQHRSMRIARKVVSLRQHYINTPAKRKWLRFGLPVVLFAALMALPIDYTIKGNASVLAVRQNSLPALVGSRLLEVAVREGEQVKAGQVLARFDTHDIQLQLSQLEQEYERSLLESDAALNMGDEAQMQISRLNAAKAAAMADKLRLDLARAVVRAPFDGLVLGAQTLSTRIGEVLRLGEPALQVVDPTAWQVKAMLRERDLIFLDQFLAES